MGETGVIYYLIPIGYLIIYLLLLVLAVLVHFFRRTRSLGAYFLVAAVTSIPGFVIGFYLCVLYFRWEKEVLSDPTLNQFVGFAIFQAPFAISLAFVALGITGGVYIVRRSRMR